MPIEIENRATHNRRCQSDGDGDGNGDGDVRRLLVLRKKLQKVLHIARGAAVACENQAACVLACVCRCVCVRAR